MKHNIIVQPLPFKGKKLPVEVEAVPFGFTRISLRQEILHISLASTVRVAPEKVIQEQILLWLKSQTCLAITKAIEKQRLAFDFKYNTFTIKDTRSRWGSCSIKQNMNFSWRLILALPEVLEYVVSHEIAHLSQMNHSKSFWEIVKQRCPSFVFYRDWLKRNGAEIMRWQPEVSLRE